MLDWEEVYNIPLLSYNTVAWHAEKKFAHLGPEYVSLHRLFIAVLSAYLGSQPSVLSTFEQNASGTSLMISYGVYFAAGNNVTIHLNNKANIFKDIWEYHVFPEVLLTSFDTFEWQIHLYS